jgi:hypothetical protein
MKPTSVLVLALLVAGGCGASSSSNDHTLVSDASEVVEPGTCVPVEGPYALPDGADVSFVVTDVDDTDDMDVGVIDDALGCDFSSGYGVVLDTASVSGGDNTLVSGNYDFIVECRNAVDNCLFNLTWSATY